jgi:hypothetical protein
VKCEFCGGETEPRSERAPTAPTMHEGDLAAMAEDAALQRELRQIEEEFAVAERDGLDSATSDGQ